MKKLLAGTLLLAGTSVGGGMILLPAVIGVYGYWSAILILFAIWALNVSVAFTLLEANTYLPQGTNFISMAEKLLGKKAKIFTWIICLTFLYTLMCVYISGVTEILSAYMHIPSIYLSCFAILLIGLPIYLGITQVSRFNTFIVTGMFITFFIILLFLVPHSKASVFLSTKNYLPFLALPVVFTSFGYLNLIPSIREFFNDDIKQIKKAILFGSIIPLTAYVALTTTVMGIIPISGPSGLKNILRQKESILAFKKSLITHIQYASLGWIIEIFIFCAIVSSFIGIALSLYDFLADGLKIKKTSFGKLKLLLCAFIPPLFITLTQSQLFLKALGFAGLIATILYGLYPIVLSLAGRYSLKLKPHYKSPFGLIGFSIIATGCLMVIGVELKTLGWPQL